MKIDYSDQHPHFDSYTQNVLAIVVSSPLQVFVFCYLNQNAHLGDYTHNLFTILRFHQEFDVVENRLLRLNTLFNSWG